MNWISKRKRQNIKNEKRNIANTAVILKIIILYYEQFYGHKLRNKSQFPGKIELIY